MHKETRTTRKKMNPRFHPMCWGAMVEIGGRKNCRVIFKHFASLCKFSPAPLSTKKPSQAHR